MAFAALCWLCLGSSMALAQGRVSGVEGAVATESSTGSQGLQAGPGATLPATPAALPYRERVLRMSFRELGAVFPLQLRGVDGRNGVPFSIRADEVVVKAKLNLLYSYSPALLPDISHINVMLNEQVIRSLPVPTSGAGITHTVEIDIPPALITEYNRLNVQLIGHYTLECEDPLHSSLWAVVGNDSWIELTVAPLRLENDLSLLPLPFFDRRSPFQLDLPFAFAAMPDPTLTEASAILASWFGGQASYRGARFPVHLGALPRQGNAVVVATSRSVIAGLTLPTINGPTISLVANPNDPYGKLLLVLGRDSNEAKLAATALTVGNQALTGSSVLIRDLVELAPRQPYDAPNWLPAYGPVRFGDLVDVRDLTVSGYSPDVIRVPLRLPPDLFGWRSPGIPVDLHYRYTPRPHRDQSTLNINVGPTFLRSIPIPTDAQAAPNMLERLVLGVALAPGAGATQKFDVPLFMLPAQSQLLFHFYYEAIKEDECLGVLVDNVRGSIDADSTINISGLSHYIEMPNLAVYANAGFPFTRLADLSETTVVMPDAAGAHELAAFLGLMGRMGESTGYPVIRVRVTNGRDLKAMENKDLLVLSSGNNQPLLKEWAERLPFAISGEERRFTITDRLFHWFGWLNSAERRELDQRRAELLMESTANDVLIAGIESPLTAGRSVVVVASNSPAGLQEGVDQMTMPESPVIPMIQGSFALIRGKQAATLATEQTYAVGKLNPITALQYYLAYRPVFLVLLGILGILILASFFFLRLRSRARERLNP